MSTVKLLAVIVLSFVLACAPRKPDMFTISVPAGPLMHFLDHRRHSFSSLKALARLEIEKGGRKRIFEFVGAVVDDQRRFRLEAYGPLGQSLMAVVWDGDDIVIRMPDEDKVVRTGPAGLEKLLGRGLVPRELCAALSGNIPEAGSVITASRRCNQEGGCLIELGNNETIRRIRVDDSVSGSMKSPQIQYYELYRSDKLLFRTQFNHYKEISHYLLPQQIIIESYDKNLSMTVEYSEIELNSPVSDDAFTLSDEAEDTDGK